MNTEISGSLRWITASAGPTGPGGHPDGLWWEDRQWVAHVLTELDDFMHTLLDEEWRDRQTGHTDVDAKAHMFINHHSISYLRAGTGDDCFLATPRTRCRTRRCTEPG